MAIPTFNRAALLRETVKSVLTQTFDDFCLIISDNASTDETPDVVRSFADDRIDYVRAEHNIGAAGNFRRVLELAVAAGTDFMVILPDDDLLYPGHLDAAVSILERDEDVGLVHTAFNLIDDRSEVTRVMRPLGSRSKVERRDAALERLMVNDFPICFSSVVYRTAAIARADGIRPEEEPFGDLQLWMRIALDWDFGYVGTPLAGLRIHDATTTSSIGVEHGVASDRRDLALLHTQIRSKRRSDFLASAPLDPGRANRLRALATHHDLAERAYWGLSTSEVAAELPGIVRAHPPIALRASFWRLVVAQLGLRRVAAALRRAAGFRGRLRQASSSQV